MAFGAAYVGCEGWAGQHCVVGFDRWTAPYCTPEYGPSLGAKDVLPADRMMPSTLISRDQHNIYLGLVLPLAGVIWGTWHQL